MRRPPRLPVLAPALLLALLAAACSPRAFVANRISDAVSEGGESFATEDDPRLARDAAPFALKSMESLLAASPGHKGLLAALCRGFTQYAVAFVRQDALEAPDEEARREGIARANRLLDRAREYGLEGLAAGRPDFRAAFGADPKSALAATEKGDVPLLFWTGAAWGVRIGASQDDPAVLADFPRAEALIRRAEALDGTYDGGAIQEALLAIEGSKPEAMGGSVEKARGHFARAMELSGGKKVSPLVTLAETVCVRIQDRTEFLALLDRALAFDAYGTAKEYRLANLLAQRRARWLKGRVDELFLE